MATEQATTDFILDQARLAGHIHARRMFGDYALYLDKKVVGLICDNQLFIKISSVSDEFLDDSYISPPFPGAKNYLNVPEEMWEDRDWLCRFIQKTAAVLPEPKPKKKKT